MRRDAKNSLLFGLIALLALTAPTFASPLPDTGQTKCYNDTEEIPCPQPGEPFYGQDGNYLINPPSYTKLDENGNDLPDDASGWVMVRDNVTGLIWEAKQSRDNVKNYADPHDADNTYTWYDPNPATNCGNAGTPGDGTDTEDFITAINASGLGGYRDWRLPTAKELQNIANYGRWGPATFATFFSLAYGTPYWTGNTLIGSPIYAWRVFFVDGHIGGNYKSESKHALAVRGGTYRLDLVDNKDGTITDPNTGIMWQAQDDGVLRTWQSAIIYCDALNLSDYDDWRLPTNKELYSIVDITRSNPAIDIDFFSGSLLGTFWTSTTGLESGYTERAWGLDFSSGHLYGSFDKSTPHYVRALRGGQSFHGESLFLLTPVQSSALVPKSWTM